MVEARTPQQVHHHYEVERELAARLKNATREARSHLYSEVYSELFAKVLDHPQLAKRTSVAERADQVERQLTFLRPLLGKDSTFLEIGAGDCALTLAMAKLVRSAIAVDVTPLMPDETAVGSNFRLHLSKGTDLGVPDGTVSLVYSNQLMEHLHPEDAIDQVRNIYRALIAGGIYVCRTPNRLTGPHDISRNFDATASGFHLREYSATELETLFLANGFSKLSWHVGLRGRYYRVPIALLRPLETVLQRLSQRACREIGSIFPIRNLLNGTAIATK
jgi:SAM-dependent methyltransferase